MTLTPYQQMRADRAAGLTPPPGRPPSRVRLDPETAKKRSTERNRRNAEARRRAVLILARRHPDEFADLMATEAAGVDAERGPLPGDPRGSA